MILIFLKFQEAVLGGNHRVLQPLQQCLEALGAGSSDGYDSLSTLVHLSELRAMLKHHFHICVHLLVVVFEHEEGLCHVPGQGTFVDNPESRNKRGSNAYMGNMLYSYHIGGLSHIRQDPSDDKQYQKVTFGLLCVAPSGRYFS